MKYIIDCRFIFPFRIRRNMEFLPFLLCVPAYCTVFIVPFLLLISADIYAVTSVFDARRPDVFRAPDYCMQQFYVYSLFCSGWMPRRERLEPNFHRNRLLKIFITIISPCFLLCLPSDHVHQI